MMFILGLFLQLPFFMAAGGALNETHMPMGTLLLMLVGLVIGRRFESEAHRNHEKALIEEEQAKQKNKE